MRERHWYTGGRQTSLVSHSLFWVSIKENEISSRSPTLPVPKDLLDEVELLPSPTLENFYNNLRFGRAAPRHFYALPNYLGRHEDLAVPRPPIEPRPARGGRRGPWAFAQRLFRSCATLIRIVAAGTRLAAQSGRRNRRGPERLKMATARARHLIRGRQPAGWRSASGGQRAASGVLPLSVALNDITS
jgi:hypothetical protein